MSKAVELGGDYDDDLLEESEQDELEEWLYPLRDHFLTYRAEMEEFIQLIDSDIPAAIRHLTALAGSETFQKIRSLIYDTQNDARAEIHEEFTELLSIHIRNAARMEAGLSSLAILMAIVLGVVMARHIAGPVKALESAALKVGQGRLDARVDIKLKDEIWVLARAFNQMVADLKQTTISKTFLDNIIESLPHPVIVTHPDLTIQMVNAAVCRLSNYTKAELTGQSVKLIIGSQESESSTFDQLLLRGAVKNIELTCITKQKRKIPILFSAAALTREEKIESIICAARDIEEIKAAEAALQKAHDELEERVAERTQTLAETTERLQQELVKRRAASEALRLSENQLRRLSYNVLKAQEDERKRLANELHDEMGQSLSLFKMQLAAMQRKLPPEQSTLADELLEMRQHLNRVIDDVRRLSRDLSPAALVDLGLSAALEKIGKDVAKNYPIAVTFETAAIDYIFSQDDQIVIYRIFQEAFTNIVKHAEASRVEVKILIQDRKVLMRVEDDGQGFDPDEVDGPEEGDGSLGMASLRERARMINADFELWSEKGKGTRLSFTIPIRNGKLS